MSYWIKKKWDRLSILGISNKIESGKVKLFVLTNQINLIILLSMLLVLVVNLAHHCFFEPAIDFGTLRVVLLALSSLFNLFLVANNKGNTARISTVVLPVLLFIYLPLSPAFVEEESFLYYPFIAIAFSIIPHLLFSFRNERKTYILLNSYAFSGVLLSDILILAFSDNSLNIRPIVVDFYAYYKLSHILMYLFINLSIIHLKNQNRLSEKSLQKKNLQLSTTLDNLKEAQEHLIQTEKMATLGVLISGIAHEINTPLNFIYLGMQNLELKLEDYQLHLKNARISETNPEFFTIGRSFIVDLSYLVQSMKHGVERTNEIINSLGNYARKDANQMAFSSIHEEIDNALLFLVGKHKGKIKIVKNYGTFQPVKCYPGLLNQAFVNLIKNAIEAIESKGEIIITTKEVLLSENNVKSKKIQFQLRIVVLVFQKKGSSTCLMCFSPLKRQEKARAWGCSLQKTSLRSTKGQSN